MDNKKTDLNELNPEEMGQASGGFGLSDFFSGLGKLQDGGGMQDIGFLTRGILDYKNGSLDVDQLCKDYNIAEDDYQRYSEMLYGYIGNMVKEEAKRRR